MYITIPWKQQNHTRGSKGSHRLCGLSWFQLCDALWLSCASEPLWMGDTEFLLTGGWQREEVSGYSLKILSWMGRVIYLCRGGSLSIWSTVIHGPKMKSPFLFPLHLCSMMLNILLFLFILSWKMLSDCYRLNYATPQILLLKS